jgi:hypothetical protein
MPILKDRGGDPQRSVRRAPAERVTLATHTRHQLEDTAFPIHRLPDGSSPAPLAYTPASGTWRTDCASFSAAVAAASTVLQDLIYWPSPQYGASGQLNCCVLPGRKSLTREVDVCCGEHQNEPCVGAGHVGVDRVRPTTTWPSHPVDTAASDNCHRNRRTHSLIVECSARVSPSADYGDREAFCSCPPTRCSRTCRHHVVACCLYGCSLRSAVGETARDATTTAARTPGWKRYACRACCRAPDISPSSKASRARRSS